MSANDPGPPWGAQPAQSGEPERPEANRYEATGFDVAATEITGPGIAEVDVTEVVAVVQPQQAPPQPQQQSPYAPPQPQMQQPQQQQQPPSAYAPPQPAFPPPAYAQQTYAQPTYPQSAYAQPTPPQPPQQPAYYGWGAPLPPPPPRVRLPRRTLGIASAVVLVAVLALVGGITMARPTGGSASKPSTGSAAADNTVRALWRSVPANDLLPATLTREGTEAYIRLGIDPDEACGTLPSAFTAALAPATCSRVLAATYVDRTQTVTTTVGIVVVGGTTAARLNLFQVWTADANATKEAMMPHVYPVPGTVAAGFSDKQRVAWQSQVSTDGTYLVYAVAAFTDGRTGPDAAARAAGSGSALSSDSPPVQVAGDLPAAIQNLLAAKVSAAQGGSQ